MSLLCFIGVHRRSLTAIAKRHGTYVSLCEGCGRPMIKNEAGKWIAAQPL